MRLSEAFVFILVFCSAIFASGSKLMAESADEIPVVL